MVRLVKITLEVMMEAQVLMAEDVQPLPTVVAPIRKKRIVHRHAVSGWWAQVVNVNDMSFRYQKRVNLGKGVGLNLSRRGVSASARTKFGSVGTRGFSIRTGIPGLSYRSSWGKSKEGVVILLALGLVYVGAVVVYNVALFLIYLVKLIYTKLTV